MKMYKKMIALTMAVSLTSLPVCADISGIGSGIGGAGSMDAVASAEENEVVESKSVDAVALDEVGISIEPEYYTSIKQGDDGFVYVYTVDDGSIPYVIIGRYDFTSDDFAADFTEYMSGVYNDLEEIEKVPLTISGKDFVRVKYEYGISGYNATDTRLFYEENGKTYMFGQKVLDDPDYQIEDGFLEKIAGSMKMLAGGYDDYKYHVDSKSSVTEKKEKNDTGESSMSFGNTTTNDVVGTIGTSTTDINETTVEEPVPKDSNDIVFTEDMAGYAGTWVPFEDGFKLYLPSTWNEFIVDESQKKGGCLYQAGDARAISGEIVPYIAVNYGETYGLDTIEKVADDLETSGYDVSGIVNVNGIPCVSYTYEEPDLSGMMFFYPGRTDYVFAVIGYNYTQCADILNAVLCSISLT